MSGKKIGTDCCGDRYDCPCSIECKCGCELAYCVSCFSSHCVEIIDSILKDGTLRPKVMEHLDRRRLVLNNWKYEDESYNKMAKRKCIHCNRPGEECGPQELRPYGPGGTDVCAECTFHGPHERLIEAERQLTT